MYATREGTVLGDWTHERYCVVRTTPILLVVLDHKALGYNHTISAQHTEVLQEARTERVQMLDGGVSRPTYRRIRQVLRRVLIIYPTGYTLCKDTVASPELESYALGEHDT